MKSYSEYRKLLLASIPSNDMIHREQPTLEQVFAYWYKINAPSDSLYEELLGCTKEQFLLYIAGFAAGFDRDCVGNICDTRAGKYYHITFGEGVGQHEIDKVLELLITCRRRCPQVQTTGHYHNYADVHVLMERLKKTIKESFGYKQDSNGYIVDSKGRLVITFGPSIPKETRDLVFTLLLEYLVKNPMATVSGHYNDSADIRRLKAILNPPINQPIKKEKESMSTSTREKTALHDESYRLFHELKSLGVDTTDFWQPDSYPSRTTNEMSAHVSFLRRQLTKAKSETNTINKSQSQENKNMETGIITRAYAAAKKDATVGAGMTIAHQTVNTLKAPMLAILNKQFKNVPVAAVASMVLETDIGEGAFAIALGALLRNVPDTWTKDRKVAYIADRLSEFGWYKATLFASEFVMAPLREHMAGLIAAMPDDTSEGE